MLEYIEYKDETVNANEVEPAFKNSEQTLAFELHSPGHRLLDPGPKQPTV